MLAIIPIIINLHDNDHKHQKFGNYFIESMSLDMLYLLHVIMFYSHTGKLQSPQKKAGNRLTCKLVVFDKMQIVKVNGLRANLCFATYLDMLFSGK